MSEIRKVERNGKVGVLISHGYGAGWSTWGDVEQALFSPEIIELVENNKFDEITDELCRKLFGDYFYTGGRDGLKVHWLDKGTCFMVEEYDGAESLTTTDDLYFIA